MMSTPRRRRATAASVLLTLALSASACTGDGGDPEDSDAGPSSGGTSATEPAALQTRATIGKITGRFPAGDRDRLKEKVEAVVDGWLDAAYVGGDYPRTDFDDSFPGFSDGAADDARRDRDLMTNASVGGRIEGVEATKRRLRVDALAVNRRAVGVTARFVLDFDTTGQVARSERVKGRLFMVYRDGDWQVFGYDVTKGSNR